MHLGPEAMRMIGEGIAQDIAGSSVAKDGSSWFAHEVEEIDDDDEDNHPAMPSSARLSQ